MELFLQEKNLFLEESVLGWLTMVTERDLFYLNLELRSLTRVQI